MLVQCSGASGMSCVGKSGIPLIGWNVVAKLTVANGRPSSVKLDMPNASR